MNYGYAYQRVGGPLLSWKNGPPNQTRAAETRGLGAVSTPSWPLYGNRGSLGSYVDSGPMRADSSRVTFAGSLGAIVLPRPGAPEVMGDCGCAGKCGGKGGCGTSVSAISGVAELTDFKNPLVVAGWATAAYLLYKKLKKKR